MDWKSNLSKLRDCPSEHLEEQQYSNSKVYKTKDIIDEIAADRILLNQRSARKIEWVFKGCEPSGPLKILLDGDPANGIKKIDYKSIP